MESDCTTAHERHVLNQIFHSNGQLKKSKYLQTKYIEQPKPKTHKIVQKSRN